MRRRSGSGSGGGCRAGPQRGSRTARTPWWTCSRPWRTGTWSGCGASSSAGTAGAPPRSTTNRGRPLPPFGSHHHGRGRRGAPFAGAERGRGRGAAVPRARGRTGGARRRRPRGVPGRGGVHERAMRLIRPGMMGPSILYITQKKNKEAELDET